MTTQTTAEEVTQSKYKNAGRNDPCPCGSGKKFKRCHGFEKTFEESTPAATTAPDANANAGTSTGMPQMPGGFDPSQIDPAVLMQFTQALQRLPRGQMMKLQGLMQKAMAGHDVTREAAVFEKTLPPELRSVAQMMSGTLGQNAGMDGATADAQAVADTAGDANSGDKPAPTEEQQKALSKFGKFFKGMFKK